MAESWHYIEPEKEQQHHAVQNSTEGGHCLGKHGVPSDKVPTKKGTTIHVPTKNSCSYRWQAFKQAEAQSTLYNHPKYDSLCQQRTVDRLWFKESRIVDGKEKSFYELKNLQAPAKRAWDVGRGFNFQVSYLPYQNEPHHLVPDFQLAKVLHIRCEEQAQEKREEVLQATRSMLLGAGYNIHHMVNMMILPLDTAVADALELPVHLEMKPVGTSDGNEYTQDDYHRTYSLYVERTLSKLAIPVVKTTVEHGEEPQDHESMKGQFEQLRQSLEQLSGQLRKWIEAVRKKYPDVSSLEILGRRLLKTLDPRT